MKFVDLKGAELRKILEERTSLVLHGDLDLFHLAELSARAWSEAGPKGLEVPPALSDSEYPKAIALADETDPEQRWIVFFLLVYHLGGRIWFRKTAGGVDAEVEFPRP